MTACTPQQASVMEPTFQWDTALGLAHEPGVVAPLFPALGRPRQAILYEF